MQYAACCILAPMSLYEIFNKYDIHPVKRFGQNFLIDRNIQQKIVKSLPLGKGKTFIEIGPGLGAITRPLLEAGETVVSIELDKKLQAYLTNELVPEFPNQFCLIKGDALECLNLDLIQSLGDEVVLVGNLPYYISSPILFRTLDLSDHCLEAYYTLQKEFADRLTARAGTRAYGRLSASFGLFAEATKLFDIAPSCFSPKPDINSSFVRINFKQRYRVNPLREEYLALVKAAFSERRKQLAGLMVKNYGMKSSEIEDSFIRLELSPKIRAEELTPMHFWKLLEYVHKSKNKV